MLTIGLWLTAIGILLLSLQNFEVAIVLFGIAYWLMS